MQVLPYEGDTAERVSQESTSACMVSLDRGLRVVAANQEMFRRMCDIGSGDVCGSAFCDLLDGSIRTRVRHQMERLLDGQQPRFQERSVAIAGSGSSLRGDLMATAIARNAGRVEGVVVVLRTGDAEPYF